MKNKIIFLDIDGVLNHRLTRSTNSHGCIGIDFSLVQIFKRIIKETGAKVVLSSTWRLYNDLVKNIEDNLCPDVEIIGKTIDLWNDCRGSEIEDWINKNGPISNFAIIDDSTDMGKFRHGPHFFQTFFDKGLTEEIADSVIEFLNKEIDFSKEIG